MVPRRSIAFAAHVGGLTLRSAVASLTSVGSARAAGPEDTLPIGVPSKAPTRGNPFMAATVPFSFWDAWL